MRFSKGTKIANRYIINNFLGEGSFGEVYHAESDRYKDIALKMLPFDSTCINPQNILREASTMAMMEHPNVVKLHEIGLHIDDTGKYGYIAMEYINGGTLRTLLNKQVRLSIERTLELCKELLSALSFAHNLTPPVIHGDIKPENVLLSNKSHAYLSDFGVAQLACEITGMTTAEGTLFYMPPECLWGYATPASDVFCLGMLMYTMLTGVSPFILPDFYNMTDKERRHAIEISRQTSPKPPSVFNPLIDNMLDKVILNALALDVKQRYKNANELLDALELKNDITVEPNLKKEDDFESLSQNELKSDIPQFKDNEYHELALNGNLSKAEITTLWEFYCDLESILTIDSGGIFSPLTMTGYTIKELENLDGQSFTGWLFANETTCDELRLIKEIGKQFWANQNSMRAQRVGKLLYITSVAIAKLRFNEVISSLPKEQLNILCESFLERKSLPPKYRYSINSFKNNHLS